MLLVDIAYAKVGVTMVGKVLTTQFVILSNCELSDNGTESSILTTVNPADALNACVFMTRMFKPKLKDYMRPSNLKR